MPMHDSKGSLLRIEDPHVLPQAELTILFLKES